MSDEEGEFVNAVLRCRECGGVVDMWTEVTRSDGTRALRVDPCGHTQIGDPLTLVMERSASYHVAGLASGAPAAPGGPTDPDPELMAWIEDHGLDPASLTRQVDVHADGSVTLYDHHGSLTQPPTPVSVQPHAPLPMASLTPLSHFVDSEGVALCETIDIFDRADDVWSPESVSRKAPTGEPAMCHLADPGPRTAMVHQPG